MDRRTFLGGAVVGSVAAGLGACSHLPRGAAIPSKAREADLVAAANFGPKTAVSGRQGLAVTTHPLATQAAIDVLKEGGNAADAAATAALTQCVVEPHMTTLTGVYSILYYDAKTGKTQYINGSNNAPKNMPLKAADMKNLLQMSKDGRLVTVPGYWAGVEATLDKLGSGKINRKRALAPAIHYARNGFEIHPFLWGEIFMMLDILGGNPQSREIYLPNNVVVKPGDTLYQHRAADFMEQLAEGGNDFFYHGDFAKRFSKVVQDAGGWVTPQDFADYQVMYQEPVQGTYRGFDLIGSPAPDFGGVNFIEIMNLIEMMDIQKMGPAWDSSETALKMLQAISLTTAENVIGRYTGKLPSTEKLISKEYAEERFGKLKGKPTSLAEMMGLSTPPPGSNHLTVTDAEGNVATVLHSCMSMPYSNGLYVDGLWICAAGVHYGSGLPKPGERINARILPHMFLKNGKPVLAGGSPSVSLMENMVQNSTNILDFGLSIEEAVNKPRFGGSSMGKAGAMLWEANMPEAAAATLRKTGLQLDVVNPWNWSHGSYDSIAFDSTGMAYGCGDPRRTAMALAV